METKYKKKILKKNPACNVNCQCAFCEMCLINPVNRLMLSEIIFDICYVCNPFYFASRNRNAIQAEQKYKFFQRYSWWMKKKTITIYLYCEWEILFHHNHYIVRWCSFCCPRDFREKKLQILISSKQSNPLSLLKRKPSFQPLFMHIHTFCLFICTNMFINSIFMNLWFWLLFNNHTLFTL